VRDDRAYLADIAEAIECIEKVWRSVEDDLPVLKDQVARILAEGRPADE